ncbi:hypothetical protein OG455_36715 [Kitasatospora sp. NBC_01287]|uniref:hypothetical protein n=1 Tax=Kitasatospora sp. NBC_01287 TaxID=2903573 RepID=UPI002259FA5F|nr:hypothetical protein [Kitasatospora sp. NBC_01287]MCX4743912.1 hypothetical protein [Kitasatospora sp. NBC_01287]MCX4750989.1 hypothetical protein [Kitasatospora sp. NBC_01287]
MTDSHAERPSTRRLIDCQDCQARPDSGDVRTLSVGQDMAVTEIWHTDKCPTYTIERILLEAGAAKVKEQDARAKEAFPIAHQRLQEAAAAVPADNVAAPFVTALLELVQAQADHTGRFVTLPTWTEILDRNFPPQDSLSGTTPS